MNLNLPELSSVITKVQHPPVSIPIRDLMNLNLLLDLRATCPQAVSIPIRDLMNLNHVEVLEMCSSERSFNPY